MSSSPKSKYQDYLSPEW